MPQPQVKWQGDGLIFKTLGAGDEAEIAQIENLAEWLRGSLRKEIAAGAMCLVALQNEKVVGSNLIAFGDVLIPLINLQRTFRKSEAWSEHIAVHRDCRRRGIASKLRYRAFEELRKRGIKRVYAGALRHNVVSLQSARKVGHREFVDVRYLRLLGIETWRYKRVKAAREVDALPEDLAA
jgi:GNAT superfamily N-acetyltransferase